MGRSLHAKPRAKAHSPELISYRNDVIAKISANQNSRNTRNSALSLGLEQEFFLLNAANELACHEDSQRFLRELASHDGWQISPHGICSRTSSLLSVSRDLDQKRYTKVKYECAPHMLEAAFAWHYNLHDLAKDIYDTWEAISRAAQNSGVTVASLPFGDHFQSSSTSLVSRLEGRAIDSSRARFLEEMTGHVDQAIVSFTSYTAGTQVHVGGLDWLERPELIQSLFAFEPLSAWYASMLAAKGERAQAHGLMKRRFEVYDLCFPTFPLIGIPAFDSWSLESWVEGMLEGPLVGPPEDTTSGRAIAALPQSQWPSPDDFMRRARDFQFVRPRFGGTIEFRADGALPDPSSMIAVAALRFALAIRARTADAAPPLPESRLRWQNIMHGEAPELDRFLDEAKDALSKRGLKEELYLK